MINEIENYGYSDFDNPRYYNIRWLMLLSEVEKTIKKTGNIFDVD
jgi:hypothetical protein